MPANAAADAPKRKRRKGADAKELSERYVNFRVSPEEFKALKMDALAHDMTLGELLMHTYKASKAIKG